MILKPGIEQDEQHAVDYYRAHYSEIHLVTCSKCGSELALEIKGEIAGLKLEENGYTVVPLGSDLMSCRLRIDGVLGYQCGARVKNPEYAPSVKLHKELMAQYDRDLEASLKDPGLDRPEFPQHVIEPEFVDCGNDTRANVHEEAASPSGMFMPHEVAKAQRAMELGHFEPKINRKGNTEYRESFTVERIK